MSQTFDEKTYNRRKAAVFRKTDERPYGGLSNMAAGFPLLVNGVSIRTSEALYQACRFPHCADVQREIIEAKSPMAAKMLSKKRRNDTRPDWSDVRVDVMKWCLRVKLAQNWNTFGSLLKHTGDLPIVEDSSRDAFWGAKAMDEDNLQGRNALGNLLMELREDMREHPESLEQVEPLQICDFLLYKSPISVITRIEKHSKGLAETAEQLQLDLNG